MARTIEEELVKKIEAGIRALKLRTKEPKDTGAAKALNSLKEVNSGLYDDYLKRYKEALEIYKSGK